MKNPTSNHDDNIQWLKVLLSLACVGLLALIFVFVEPDPNNRWKNLLLALIPNAIVVLIAVPVIYFLFYRHGLVAPNVAPLDVEQLAEQIVSKLPPPRSNGHYPQLAGFYETYRQVEWGRLLSEGRESIDIVVYYFDSWVNANYESIVGFFRKPGTTMRVFVPDPEDEFNVSTVHRLFPEYSKDTVKEKVARTGQRLAQALREAGGDPNRLEVYFVPHILNYSAQCLDGRIFVLSIYEMFRQSKIDSPAVVIDLSRSKHLSQYWNKELTGLLRVSKKTTAP